MPLGKDVSANMREMYKDNMKSGKAKGAGGKKRSRAQMIAIAMRAAGKSKSMKSDHEAMKGMVMKARAGA